MPKGYPPEFKRDVVAVARWGDLSVPEIAVDFDIAQESVREADVDDGIAQGQTSSEQTELVQLRRRMRRLEMENEILRRAAASELQVGTDITEHPTISGQKIYCCAIKDLFSTESSATPSIG